MNTTPIVLEEPLTWPVVGTVWIHHNGNRYIVEGFANKEPDRQDQYPTTILYRNQYSGNLYARKLIDWSRSMKQEMT